MDTTWESLLNHLVQVRRAPHRTDEAQIEAFDYILQTILEKLRDEERLAGVEGRAAFAKARAEVDAVPRS